MATTRDLRETIQTPEIPDMLSNINGYFFPDKEDRVLQSFISLRGEITMESVGDVIDDILARNLPEFELDDTDENDEILVETPKEDVINLFLTSPGGDMHAAWALIAVIEGSKIPVRTIAMGEVASAALCILMAGHQRVVVPYTSIMTHPFSTGIEGNYHEIKNIMMEYDRHNKKMIQYYHEKTGLDEDYIKENLLTVTDYWMEPEEALNLNFVDLVSNLK